VEKAVSEFKRIVKRTKATRIGSFTIGFLLIAAYYLRRMRLLDSIRDCVPSPPKQYRGMEYGKMAVVYALYILANYQGHTVYGCEEWVAKQPVLRLLFPDLKTEYFSEDRIGHMLEAISRAADNLTMTMARRLVEIFDIDVSSIFLDLTNYTFFGDYSDIPIMQDMTEQLLDYANSPKSHDRKHKAVVQEAFCSTDGGIMLWNKLLSGSTSDVSRYVPMVKRFRQIFGQDKLNDTLFAGDSKMASAENRAFIQNCGSYYICMEYSTNDSTKERLRKDLRDRKEEMEILRNEEQEDQYKGFRAESDFAWQENMYKEDRIVIHSSQYEKTQLNSLQARMDKCAERLEQIKRIGLQGHGYKNEDAIRKQVDKALASNHCKEFIFYQVCKETVVVGRKAITRGRHTSDTQYRDITKTVFLLKYSRDEPEIDKAKELAGYFVLLSNCPADRFSCKEILAAYKNAYKIEFNFKLQKSIIPAVPAHIKSPSRIRGLMFLIAVLAQLYTLCDREMLAQMRKGLKADEVPVPIKGILPQGHKSFRPQTESVFHRLKDISCSVEETDDATLALKMNYLDDNASNLIELTSADLSQYDEDSIGSLLEIWMRENPADFTSVISIVLS